MRAEESRGGRWVCRLSVCDLLVCSSVGVWSGFDFQRIRLRLPTACCGAYGGEPHTRRASLSLYLSRGGRDDEERRRGEGERRGHTCQPACQLACQL
eukprot:13110866-Heterocapsa_arctica.AAC.1